MEYLLRWGAETMKNLALLWAYPPLAHRLLDMTGVFSFMQQMGASTAMPAPPAASRSAAAGRVPQCPLCCAAMVDRVNSRTGQPFWGCRRWPACRGTKPQTKEAIERDQSRCAHFNQETNKTSIRRHGNQHGSFAACGLCGRRWKWNKVRDQWDLQEGQSASAASFLPLPGASGAFSSSAPAAAPKRRPRPTVAPAAASSDTESIHIFTDPGEENSFWLAAEESEVEIWDDNDERMAEV